ncbi:MAG TPA: hypothetical protein VFC46_12475, partial [Humisphaera sp.]|nr:hypothetical protein [Humisphaera sp.]
MIITPDLHRRPIIDSPLFHLIILRCHSDDTRDQCDLRRDMIITRSPLRISLGGGGTDLPSYYKKHSGF